MTNGETYAGELDRAIDEQLSEGKRTVGEVLWGQNGARQGAADLAMRWKLSRTHLEGRIKSLRAEANQLEDVLRWLPEALPPDVDEALYGLLLRVPR